MDPYSQPNPQQPRQHQRWPLSRKTTIIGVVAILVILIGAIMIAALANRNNPSNQTGNNTSLIYDRPGYDREKLGDAISDPMALKIAADNQAVNYQGQPVIQACNVLTLRDIQDEGLLLKANAIPTPLTRVYNDGKGKAAYNEASISTISGGIGLGMDVNNCNYVLEAEDAAMVGINLFQPFAVSPSLVNQVIQRDYNPIGSIEGLESFKLKKDTSPSNNSIRAEYMLRKGDTATYVKFSLPSNQAAKEQTLLTKAAKNFSNQLTRPTGMSTVSYDSPVFSKSYARACDLLTNNDIKQLSGKDATPLVLEGIAPSIGLQTTNSSQNEKKAYPNINNECTRTAPKSGASLLPSAASIKVEATSYLEEAPAKLLLEGQRKANPNNRERMNVNGIGDEAVASIDANSGGNLTFRKGRIVVNISLDTFAMQALSLRSLSNTAARLTPIAENAAERVKQ